MQHDVNACGTLDGSSSEVNRPETASVFGEPRDVVQPCGLEQADPPVRIDLVHELTRRQLPATFQHLNGFVEHDEGGLAKICFSLIELLYEASQCAYQHIHHTCNER